MVSTQARVAATFSKPSPLLAKARGLTRQQRKKVAAPRALEPVAPGSDDGGSESDEEAPAPSGVADLEELGPGLESRADEEAAALGLRPPKDMVTPAQAKALKKEGYKLIGSHSAVKLRAGKESEIPNFKGSDLGRFPLVSADFWTSDHLLERPRSVDAFPGTRARGKLTLKRR